MPKLPVLLDVRHGTGTVSPASYSFWFLLDDSCFATLCSFLPYSKGNQLYAYVCSVLQLCPALCDPMDCSLSGSSVHGILQASILEWVALPSSRGSSPPRGWDPHLLCLLRWQRGSLPLHHVGSPYVYIYPLFRFPSHLGHQRALRRIPCAVQGAALRRYLFQTIVVCIGQTQSTSSSHPILPPWYP